MNSTTIATRAYAQRSQEINFGEEFKPVTRANGACFHKVLACVAGKPCAHEDIEDIMDVRLCLRARDTKVIGQSAGEVGMTAVVVLAARQQVMGVGVAARADDIMDRSAISILADCLG